MKKLLAIALLLLLGAPALGQQSVVVPATMQTQAIAGTIAASTRIITGVSGKSIYITALLLTPVATSVVTFTSGTGTNCGTGTANVTAAMTFAAGQEVNWGNGNGAILVIPPATDLCITIATAAAPGAIAFAIF